MNQKRKMNDSVARIWWQIIGIIVVVLLGGGLWWAGGSLTGFAWIESTVRAAIEAERPRKEERTERKGGWSGEQSPNEGRETARTVAIRSLEAEVAGMARSAATATRFDELEAKVAQEGVIPVLIRLRAGFQVERESQGEEAAAAQRGAIQEVQQAVIDGLVGYDPVSIKRYAYLPFLGVRINQTGLAALRGSSHVLDIQEDRTSSPVRGPRGLLKEGEEGLADQQYRGEGYAIAILDTGVDKADPSLLDKVVAEGCFSTQDAGRGVQSTCPAGREWALEAESGRPCRADGVECEQGTAVARLAAGRTGVARGASLISLQVFSRLDRADACPAGSRSCLVAYDSDVIAALEQVYRWHGERRIAAVTLGLEGRPSASYCDDSEPAIKAAIDLLRSAGIATVAAAGDGARGEALSAPACVSSALSVSATMIDESGGAALWNQDDRGTGRERGPRERVAPSSNSARMLTLLAPGGAPSKEEMSGEPMGVGGTSLAASRVAGALAILRQKFPEESVETLTFRLRQTGIPIRDPRNQLVRPRIEVAAALEMDRLAQAQVAPTAPEGLVATVQSATQINLTWNDVATETGYRLERRTSSTGVWSVLATLSANQTTFQNVNLTPGRTYFYQVFATNAQGQSPPSDEVRATTFAVPLPPTGLQATKDGTTPATRINLAWSDNATNEEGYYIYRALSSGGPFTLIQTTSPNTTTFGNTGLNPNTTYHYRVSAFSGGVESTPATVQAQTDQAIPLAPSNLVATVVSTSQIDLTWTDNSPNENNFRISRATANPDGTAGTFSTLTTLPANTTTFTNSGLTRNTTYFYQVSAGNSEGDSTPVEVSATTRDTPPTSPNGLTATATSATQVTLSWTDRSDNETAFRIERRVTEPSGDWALIENLASQTTSAVGGTIGYNDLSALQATSYQYRVSATNSGGIVSSAPAGPVSVTTPPSAPASPVNLTAVGASISSITVGWVDNSTNETSFLVQQRQGTSGDWILAATVPSTTVAITGSAYSSTISNLVENQLYQVRVIARNSGGDSTAAGPASATTLLDPPAAPTNLVAINRSNTQVTPSTFQIELTWTDNSPTETSFSIRRSTTPGGPYTEVGTVGANITRYLDTGLIAETTYYYVVRASNSQGTSPASNEASARAQTTPSRPTNLQVSGIQGRQVTLAWTDNSGVEEGFRVYRKIGTGEFTLLATLPVNGAVAPSVVTYLVSNLKPSTSYTFRVTAFRSSSGQFEGESQPSNEVAVTTLAEPPINPAALQATVISPTRIDLSWNYDSEEITNVTSFRVSRKAGTGAYAVLTTPDLAVTARSFSDTTAQDGTQYTYLVQAVNATGASTGVEAARTTPLPAPSSLTAAQTSRDIIQLNWSRTSTNETSFVVERATGPTGPFAEKLTRPAGSTSATDAFDEEEVDRDQLYYYRVRARNALTTSEPSPIASAMWLSIPLSPTNLSGAPVTADDPATKIRLSWNDNATNESAFKVERKTDSTDYATVSSTVAPNAQSYTDQGLAEGVRYTYRVAATNISGDSATPPTVSVFTRAAAPTGLAITATAPGTVSLSWSDNSIRETGYSVRRSTMAAGPYSELASLPASATSYVDSGLTPGTEYFYRVFATNLGGLSAPTATVSGLAPTAPSTPTGLTATARMGTTTEIDLSWIDNSNNETSFQVERRPASGGTWTLLVTLPSSTSVSIGAAVTHRDAGLMEGQGYTYRVIASNVGGDSLPSAVATATTLVNTPAAPTGLTAVNRSDTQSIPASNQIQLRWTDNSSTETGFIVQRATVSGGPYTDIGTVGANIREYLDTTVVAGTPYFYVVRAANAEGSSAPSNEASATAGATPGKPASLAVVTGSTTATSVTLTWTDTSSVELGFRVYQRIGTSGAFSLVAEVAPKTTPAPSSASTTITNLLSGTTYEFEVTAYWATGESQPSNRITETTLSAPPSGPSGLARTVISSSRIDLTWTDTSHNEDEFEILRSPTTGAGYTIFGTVPANTTSFSNTGLTPETTYFYIVRARNAQGLSANSNEVSGTTPPAPPAAPSGLVLDIISSFQLNLRWSDHATNETGYRLQRRIGTGSWEPAISLPANATSYQDVGLEEGTTYSYRVWALNVNGDSALLEGSVTMPTLPAAPTGLAASAGSASRLTLTWIDNANNETGFRIYRRQGLAGNFTLLTTAPSNPGGGSTNYLDTGLTEATSYSYRVSSINNGGESEVSEVATTTTFSRPAAPVLLPLTVLSSTSIKVDWTFSGSGQTQFKVERSGQSGGAFATVATVGPTIRSFTDTGLNAKRTYFYRIIAANTTDESVPSNEGLIETADGPPATPSALAATVNTTTSVVLAWTNNATNAANFEIERREGTGAFSLLTIVPATSTTHTDNGLTPGTSYTYRVRATNSFGLPAVTGTSDWSNEATVTPPAAAPNAPTSLLAQAITSTSIQLTWTDNSTNETGFQIERKVGTGPFEAPILLPANATGSVNFVDSGLTSGTNYTYRVRAINQAGNSAWSGESSAIPPANVPAGPTSLTASTAGRSITLSWVDNATDETGYRIERSTTGAAGPFVEIASLGQNTATYLDTNLTELTTYHYQVVAVNLVGSSAPASADATTQLLAPTGLSGTASTFTSLTLTWTDNSTVEDGFLIYRSTTGVSGSFALLPGVISADSTTFSDTGLTAGTTYHYQIVTLKGSTESAKSNTVAVTLPTEILAPTGLTATTAGRSVTLNWTDNATDETGYRVLRSPTGLAGSFVEVANLGQNAVTYLDTNLIELTTYHYQVVATNLFGSSAPATGSFTTVLLAPTTLSGTVSTFTSLTLTWTDNSAVEDGFRIYRSSTGPSGTFTALPNVINANITTFSDTGLTSGTTYHYEIVTRKGATESARSNTVVVTLPTQPLAPTSLAVVAEQATRVALTWQYTGTNHTGFRVERRTAGSTTWTQLAEINTPATRTYADTTTSGGLFYNYRVLAYNTGGNSLPSNEASVTTPALPPATPTELTATFSNGNVLLSWKDNSDNEIGFRVQRRLVGSTTFLALRGAESLAPNTTSYVDETATQGRSYEYRIRSESVLNNVTSAWSSVATITLPVLPPLEPSDLSAIAVSPFQVNLAWTDNSDNEDGFQIYRRVGTFGTLTEIASVGSGVTKYEDTERQAGTTYAYSIRAFNTGGESEFIGPVSVTTPSASITAPSLLVATPASSSQVNLSWRDNSNNETGFRVERRTSAETLWTFVALIPSATRLQTGGTITYQAIGLTAGVAYNFRVIATTDTEQSAPSNEATATTTPGLPATPADFQAQVVSATSVQLTWTAVVNNVTGYRIQRRVGDLGTWSDLVNLPGTSITYTDTPLTTGTTYFYQIAAINGTILSGYSAPVSATPINTGGTAPAAPSNLIANAVSPTQIDLVWISGTTSVTGFRIERRAGATPTWETLTTVGATVRIHSDINLTTGVTYTYRVFALNGQVPSASASNEANATPLSGGITTPPTAPSRMLVSAMSTNAAEVRWTDTSSNESGFRIYRRQGTTSFQEVGVVGLNVTVWRDEGLIANSTYEYRVVAFNLLGESLSSNAESVTIPISTFTSIENGESLTRQVGRNGFQYFRVYVPPGVTELEATLIDSTRVELYVLRDRQPTTSVYNCRVLTTSTTRFCRILSPPPSAGDWHILIRSTSIITETYTLRVSYVGGEIDASLGTPTNLQAQVASNTQIDLSWVDNASGETGYQIQRRTGNGTFQNLAQVAGNITVYQDENLTPGTQYRYVVAALFPARTSAYSNEASATTTGTAPVAPSAPTMAAATSVTATGATLNWTAGSTNHTGFQLQRRLDGATVEWSTIATPASSATSHVDTGLTSSSTYRYRIAATNGFGTSPFSNEVTVTTLSLPTPSAPTNLAATAVSSSQINLGWGLGGTNQTAFQIERSAGSPGNWQNIAVIPGQFLTSYQDTGLNEGTTYFYRVFAVNSFGPSPASNIANATTQGTPITPPPTAPANLTATAVSSTGINLSWTATSVTHTGFLLQRRIGAGDWTTIATPGATATSFSDTGLTAGTTYLYRIQATSPVGPSPFSTEATATTQSGGGGGGSVAPATPTGLIVTAASNSSAEIRWSTSAGATEYRLYRATLSNSTMTLIATTLVSAPAPTQYLDSGLIANVTYRYQVEAVNATGASAPTAAASVTIPVSAFTSIENQETATRSIGRNGQQFFRLYVPEGATELVVTMTGSINVDLLVQLDRQPTINSFNCRATGSQAVGPQLTRTCLIRPVIAGDWHILARSTSISSVTYTLSAFYSLPGGTATQQVGRPAAESLPNRRSLPSDNEGRKGPLEQDRPRRSLVRPE